MHEFQFTEPESTQGMRRIYVVASSHPLIFPMLCFGEDSRFFFLQQFEQSSCQRYEQVCNVFSTIHHCKQAHAHTNTHTHTHTHIHTLLYSRCDPLGESSTKKERFGLWIVRRHSPINGLLSIPLYERLAYFHVIFRDARTGQCAPSLFSPQIIMVCNMATARAPHSRQRSRRRIWKPASV
jgi:hypothetical protein